MQTSQATSSPDCFALRTLGQPHVYALPTMDRSRIKIGRSVDPIRRIVDLTRVYSDIDLSRSVVVGVDTHNVESLLHTVFEPFRMQLPECADGYTEWFAGDLVDDVVDLCQQIAHHRKTEYLVIRDVPNHVEHYRPEALEKVTLTLAKKPRKISPPINPAGFGELTESHTKLFLRTLREQKFDEILSRRGRYALVRSVSRENEPECWLRSNRSFGSDWGWRLVRAGRISYRFDGDSHVTHLISSPAFVPKDAIRGCEYYWFSDDFAKVIFSDIDQADNPISGACATIRDAIASLPRRIDDRIYKEKWQIERDKQLGGAR